MNGGWVSLVSWWLLANLMVDDGFYFYFDKWVLILLMVDEWGLLMVDEWWLGFCGFIVDGFVGSFVPMLMDDLCGSFWLI